MTAAEFKKKWSRFQGKETSAYQEHFTLKPAVEVQPVGVGGG